MRKTIGIFLGITSLLVACQQAPKKKINKEKESASKQVESGRSLKVELNAKSGSETSGHVTFEEKEGKVFMMAHINGLTPGIHAIHIHEKADCSSEDGKSSGGHWNPTFEKHGAWGSESGYHRGDIGNFTADEGGHGMIEFQTEQWCIGCDDTAKNLMGKAIIVHQGEDDLSSQPSGAAGARVSCAGIIL
ncbi:MAG: superoxide dismutase family protein [Flavobacteriaceae bacterium]